MSDRTPDWQRAASTAEVPDDEPLGLEIGGLKVALFKVDGSYFATGNVCTHAYALLSDGFLDGCEIECPLHNGRFDVRTGKAKSSPVETDIPTYPVQVVGDAIEILLPH